MLSVQYDVIDCEEGGKWREGDRLTGGEGVKTIRGDWQEVMAHDYVKNQAETDGWWLFNQLVKVWNKGLGAGSSKPGDVDWLIYWQLFNSMEIGKITIRNTLKMWWQLSSQHLMFFNKLTKLQNDQIVNQTDFAVRQKQNDLVTIILQKKNCLGSAFITFAEPLTK